MEIKSKKLGKTLTFTQPGSFYIYVDLNGKPGSLGDQICYGGKLTGSTIGCDNPEKFENVCKKWYRSYLKNEEF